MIQKQKLLLFISFCLISNILYAHKDVWRTFDNGNIKSVIITSYIENQEINKVKIISELAYNLSIKLNYKKPILLYFENYSVDSTNTNRYYLNFSNGELNSSVRKDGYLLKKKGISIKFVGDVFEISKCLKLLEYAINNFNNIEKNQRETYYDRYYDTIRLKSIDVNLIARALEIKTSKTLSEILHNKVYGHNKDIGQGFTYFWQDNKFHIERVKDGNRKTILSLSNITYFYNEDFWGNAIVFDSSSSFYALDYHDLKVSPHKEIKDKFSDYNVPYRIEMLDKSRYAISSSQPPVLKKRIMIYWLQEDILIEDLDKFILKTLN